MSDAVTTVYRLPQPDPPTEPYHDVALSFDTTASMARWIHQLREDLQTLVERIFERYSDVKIAIIAHGDYGSDDPVVDYIDFTTDVQELQEFVDNVQDTDGGDWEECYEYVLREIRTELTWREGSKRQLIMFGDAAPHKFEDYVDIMDQFPEVEDQLDWEDEADELLRINVQIVPVQFGTGENEAADEFWEALAHKTWGYRLESCEPEEELTMVITAVICRGRGGEELQRCVKEITLPGVKELPESMALNLERLEFEPGSIDAIGPRQTREYVEETESENSLRRAMRDEQRMRDGLIQSNSALANTANLLATELSKQREDYEALMEAHQDMQEELDETAAELENQSSNLSYLEEEFKNIEEQLEEERSKLSETTDARDAAEERIEQLVTKSDNQEMKIAELEKQAKTKDRHEWEISILPAEDLVTDTDILIGAGKEGKVNVFEGWHKGYQRVAVKKVILDQTKVRAAIEDGLRQIRKLQHPNIAVIFGVVGNVFNGGSTSTVSIVMELADNNLLVAAVLKSQINDGAKMKYLLDAVTGLAFMHDSGFSHKSIKPSNILMVADRGKLADYGIAGMTKDVASMYKAPELYLDNPSADTRSDMWSVGITILEVMTGKKIVSQMVSQRSGFKIPKMMEQGRLPAALDKVMDPKRKELIQMCLKWEPEERAESKQLPQLLIDMLKRSSRR